MDIENQFFTEVLEKSTLFLRAWGKKIARCVFVPTNFLKKLRFKDLFAFFQKGLKKLRNSFFLHFLRKIY